MAFTQTDLDNVDAALKAGEVRVQIGDMMVTYRSIDDLMRVRGLILDELAQAAGNRRRRQLRVNVEKGIR